MGLVVEGGIGHDFNSLHLQHEQHNEWAQCSWNGGKHTFVPDIFVCSHHWHNDSLLKLQALVFVEPSVALFKRWRANKAFENGSCFRSIKKTCLEQYQSQPYGSALDIHGEAGENEPEVMAAALNYRQKHTHTHTNPITVGAIICQMMRAKNRQDQSVKQGGGSV